MSRVLRAPSTPTLSIDALLQDTYLLVVELRHGASVHSGPALWGLCVEQVEAVRSALRCAEQDAHSIDLISHSQCALLDETVLRHARDEAYAEWAKQTLQAKFFNRHQAGESLYEDVRMALRDPAANPHVLIAFHRVLMLGFLGRYRDIDDPERQQLVNALATQVAPFETTQSIITQASNRRSGYAARWISRPLLHSVAAVVLLGSIGWGLQRALADLMATLFSGQL